MKVKQSGFTLIELLIALGVMAVFALLAYRGLDSVMRLHQGASSHEQQAQAIDRFLTQLEADLRQASKVTVVQPAAQDAKPRLQLARRIESGASSAGSELALVEWQVEGGAFERRVTLASGVQTARLLEQVSEAAWLNPQPFAATPQQYWKIITASEMAALPNQSLDVQRGAGIRLTVAGKPIEKLFLVGR